MSVIYPSDKQIQASVHNICEKAPLTRRPNLISFLRDMSRNLGLRQIFTGTWDVILISCMLFGLVAVIGALDLRHSVHQLQKASVFLFAFSPVFLFLLFSLSLWKEVEGTSYPIKMTCLYTARHLIAFRVFCITCCSFAVDTTDATIHDRRPLRPSPIWFSASAIQRDSTETECGSLPLGFKEASASFRLFSIYTAPSLASSRSRSAAASRSNTTPRAEPFSIAWASR